MGEGEGGGDLWGFFTPSSPPNSSAPKPCRQVTLSRLEKKPLYFSTSPFRARHLQKFPLPPFEKGGPRGIYDGGPFNES